MHTGGFASQSDSKIWPGRLIAAKPMYKKLWQLIIEYRHYKMYTKALLDGSAKGHLLLTLKYTKDHT